ncbi:hypothetical protein PG984_001164 [Apiospora sp. TS-2023a]
MGHWLQCYAFDVIGLITFSKRFGFLDRGEDVGGVMKAIKSVTSNRGPTGTGGDYHISFKATQEKMPYLQAVIKESLRLHGVTGMVLERVVPNGGITLAGTFFPEGSIVGIVEHRDPDVFGRDADSFVPERWLTDDPEKLARMTRHCIPFGLGARTTENFGFIKPRDFKVQVKERWM